jgi:AcrR family transcriptional regulator
MSTPIEFNSNPHGSASDESEDVLVDSRAESSPVGKLPKSSPRNRSRLSVDKRRAQLLKLGQELFTNYSYDELSIDEIARRARVSKGLLYHYFPSKRDYYVAVVRAGAAELLAQTDSAPELSPLTRLAKGIDGYLDHVQDYAKPFATLLRTGIGFDPEVSKIVEETRQALLKRFLDAIPGSPSPQLRNALRGWIGFAEGAVLDWLEHEDITRDELRTLLIEMASQNVRLAQARVGFSMAAVEHAPPTA